MLYFSVVDKNSNTVSLIEPEIVISFLSPQHKALYFSVSPITGSGFIELTNGFSSLQFIVAERPNRATFSCDKEDLYVNDVVVCEVTPFVDNRRIYTTYDQVFMFDGIIKSMFISLFLSFNFFFFFFFF